MKEIRYPKGQHYIDVLDLQSNTLLIGDNGAELILKSSNSQIIARHQENIHIKNLIINGNNIQSTDNKGLVDLTFTNNCSIENCKFINFDRFGLILNSTLNFTINNNQFIRNSKSPTQNQGILVTYSTYYTPHRLSRGSITNNTLINSAMNINCYDTLVSNNTIQGFRFGAGITVEATEGCYHLTIENNTISGGEGVDVNQYRCGGIENWAKNTTIRNNTIFSNIGAGIDQGGKECFIDSNEIRDSKIISRRIDDTYNASYSTYSNNIATSYQEQFNTFTGIRLIKNKINVYENLSPSTYVEKLEQPKKKKKKSNSKPRLTWWQKILKFFGLY